MIVLTSTDFRHSWTIFDPLVAKILREGSSAELTVSENFPDCMFWDISLKLGIYIWCAWHIKFVFDRNWVTLLPVVDQIHFSPFTESGIELNPSNHATYNFIVSLLTPSENFIDIFANVLRCQLQSWYMHPVSCTTFPESGPCAKGHVGKTYIQYVWIRNFVYWNVE